MKLPGHIQIGQLSDHRYFWPTCLQSLMYHNESKVLILGNFVLDQNILGLKLPYETALRKMITNSSPQCPSGTGNSIWHLSFP